MNFSLTIQTAQAQAKGPKRVNLVVETWTGQA